MTTLTLATAVVWGSAILITILVTAFYIYERVYNGPTTVNTTNTNSCIQQTCSDPKLIPTSRISLPFDIQDSIILSASVVPALIMDIPDPILPRQHDVHPQQQPVSRDAHPGKSSAAADLDSYQAYYPPFLEISNIASTMCKLVREDLRCWATRQRGGGQADAWENSNSTIIPGGFAHFQRLCRDTDRTAARAASAQERSWAQAARGLRMITEGVRKGRGQLQIAINSIGYPDDQYFFDVSFFPT